MTPIVGRLAFTPCHSYFSTIILFSASSDEKGTYILCFVREQTENATMSFILKSNLLKQKYNAFPHSFCLKKSALYYKASFYVCVQGYI